MAGKLADYYYVKIGGRASIDGKDLKISGVDILYKLDEIPTATLSIPIGRQMKGALVGSVSDGMGIIQGLEPFTPVSVYLRADAEPSGRSAPGKDPGFPKGEFPVFKGYLAGPGQVKNRGSATASLVIQAFGEPAALAGTTQFVRGLNIAPGPPNGGSYAVARLGQYPRATLIDALKDYLNNVGADMWDTAIKPLFLRFTADLNMWTGSGTGADGAADARNNFAERAINRINTSGPWATDPKLPIQAYRGCIDPTLVNKSLLRTLGTVFFGLLNERNPKGDLWDVLMQLQQLFAFHFVPGVEADALAPVTPNMGGKAFRVIEPADYSQIDVGQLYDPKFGSYVTQVGLFVKSMQSSPWQDKAGDMRVVGVGRIKNQKSTWAGKLELYPAPFWLCPPGAPAVNAAKPGGATPDKGNPAGGEAPTKSQGEQETCYFAGDLGDRLAASYLHDMVFAHRRMSLTGRLRMDIAPGSLVQVNTAGESFTGKKDELYGCVETVNIRVEHNDGGSSASTTLGIVSVRSKAEHAGFTVEEHPLYQTQWIGSKLLSY